MNSRKMFPQLPEIIFFVFAAEFHSSDSSDDDVPILAGGTIQQEYGRNSVNHKLIYTRIFLHDQGHMSVCVCFRVRVQAASAILRVHESDPAELSEPGGQQEVEEEVLELESP